MSFSWGVYFFPFLYILQAKVKPVRESNQTTMLKHHGPGSSRLSLPAGSASRSRHATKNIHGGSKGARFHLSEQIGTRPHDTCHKWVQ